MNIHEHVSGIELSKVIVVDTETTGLDESKDEVLSLSIVDGNGAVLFDHLIKPAHRKRWPNATEIHEIKWADVKNEKTLLEYEEELSDIFCSAALIVGYNVEFDLKMLRASGAIIPCSVETFDVMEQYAEVHGKWSEWQGKKAFVKLTECAKHYGYAFQAHSSLEDAKATAHCFRALMDDAEYSKQCADREQARIDKAQSTKRIQVATVLIAIAIIILVWPVGFGLFSLNPFIGLVITLLTIGAAALVCWVMNL